MKKGFLMTLALLLVVFGAYFVSGTYARYTDNVTKTGSAVVAKWAFAKDNEGTNLTIDLKETYLASTLAEGTDGKKIIAPGTEGSFDIALKNTNTQTAVDVVVKISKTNVPTNLKFYTDAACTQALAEDDSKVTNLTAKIAAGETLETKKIYWKWPYNTDPDATIDEADTNNGKDPKEMTIGLEITGTQIAPSKDTAVTTGWTTPTVTP